METSEKWEPNCECKNPIVHASKVRFQRHQRRAEKGGKLNECNIFLVCVCARRLLERSIRMSDSMTSQSQSQQNVEMLCSMQMQRWWMGTRASTHKTANVIHINISSSFISFRFYLLLSSFFIIFLAAIAVRVLFIDIKCKRFAISQFFFSLVALHCWRRPSARPLCLYIASMYRMEHISPVLFLMFYWVMFYIRNHIRRTECIYNGFNRNSREEKKKRTKMQTKNPILCTVDGRRSSQQRREKIVKNFNVSVSDILLHISGKVQLHRRARNKKTRENTCLDALMSSSLAELTAMHCRMHQQPHASESSSVSEYDWRREREKTQWENGMMLRRCGRPRRTFANWNPPVRCLPMTG